MSNRQTFSRSELQAMPEKHKQDMIYNYIRNYIIHQVLQLAKDNKKSYLFEVNRDPVANNGFGQHFRGIQVTNEDLIIALEEVFPDCKVSYVEKWIENQSSPYQKQSVLKSGIEIDWS
jgi:hypothetical protein